MTGRLGQADTDRITGEQAALRRVATLVARGAPPCEVFAAVAEEAGRLLGCDYATLARFGPEDTVSLVAVWSSTGTGFRIGTQLRLGGRNATSQVFRTGRPTRIDDYTAASGQVAEIARKFAIRATVAVPIHVEGGLWGVMLVGSRKQPLPAGTEARLAAFTELAGTAIANAQARVELRGFAEEQAALRRVATLVAQAAPPAEVFAAVTGEAGRLLDADLATMGRYNRQAAKQRLRRGTAPVLPFPWAPSGISAGGTCRQ
jgi:GAF domain-containing protein